MITIEMFISNECSTSGLVKNLLEDIKILEKMKVDERTFSFNVYDITISIKNNEVIISDNVYINGPESIKLPLGDFCAELLGYL